MNGQRPTLEEIYARNATGSTVGPSATGAAPMVATNTTSTSGRPPLSDIFAKSGPATSATPIPTPAPQDTTVMQDIGSKLKETLVDPFAERFSNIDYNNQSIPSNIIQAGGALVGGAVDVAGNLLKEGVKVFTPKSVEDATGAAVDKAGEALSNAIPDSTKQAIADWTATHPEAAANLGAIVDIASIIPLGKGAGAVKATLTSELAAKEAAEKAAMRIAQPTKPEAFNTERVIDALKVTPTKGVKTYTELRGALDKGNEQGLARVTQELLKDKTPLQPVDFVRELPVSQSSKEAGVNGTKFNPVTEAVRELKALATKAPSEANIKLLEKINEFDDKLYRGEVIRNDINELAKLMGSNLNAFKQTGVGGVLMKGDKYTRMEAVRAGLKKIARNGMPDEVKELDEAVSDRIVFSKSMDNIANAIGREMNRSIDEGLFQKAVGGTAKLAVNISDLVTGRLVSTIARQFRNSKAPLKDIEKELQKNLEIIRKYNERGDTTKLREFLKGIGYFTASQAANQVNQPEK